MASRSSDRGARASKRLSKTERQERLREQLRVTPGARLADLAARFHVAIETVRRDLDEMSERGELVRVYGGAVAPAIGEPARSEREQQHVAERERIADHAASLVEPGCVVMVDAGSTTSTFVRHLAAQVRDATVITNCLGTAQAAAGRLKVILCPGELDAREGGVFGPATLQFLDGFHATLAVVGAGGLTEAGVFDAHSGAAWVKRKMLERAERAMLLLDHSKLGRQQTERVCALGEVNIVVTSGNVPRPLKSACTRAGAQVLVVPS